MKAWIITQIFVIAVLWLIFHVGLYTVGVILTTLYVVDLLHSLAAVLKPVQPRPDGRPMW